MPPFDAELNAVLNDRDRLRALRASNLLDSPREKIFEDVTTAICSTLNVPISLVTLIAPDRQFFKSSRGLAFDLTLNRATPIEDSTCQYVVKKGGLLVIDDVTADPFFVAHEGLKGVGAGSYLGTPLYVFGQPIGSVCAVDIKPRKWTEVEIDFLQGKANMLAHEVIKRRSPLF